MNRPYSARINVRDSRVGVKAGKLTHAVTDMADVMGYSELDKSSLQGQENGASFSACLVSSSIKFTVSFVKV